MYLKYNPIIENILNYLTLDISHTRRYIIYDSFEIFNHKTFEDYECVDTFIILTFREKQ